MKAIVKLSVGCVALAATLGTTTVLAGPHPVVNGLPGGMLVVGQAQPTTEAARRQEADKWLRQARQAMKSGNLELAKYYVERAERLNVKYDALFARFLDTPEKVRRDLATLRSAAGQPPSAPGGKPGSATSSAPSDPVTPRVGDGHLDRLPPTKRDSSENAFEVVTSPYQTEGRQPTPGLAGAAETAKAKALRLTALARTALDRGEVIKARQLAEQARSLKVPETAYAPGEVRPWEVLLEIQSAMNRSMPGGVVPAHKVTEANPAATGGDFPVTQGLYVPGKDATRNELAQAQLTAPGSQGWELYQQGLRALEAQDRDAAMQLFRRAWQYQHELDPAVRQQLRDKLQLLGPSERTTSGRPSPLDEVGVQQELLRQKLFREITTEQQAAEGMILSDPRGALMRLQELRNRVSQAEIDPAGRNQLLTLVDRSLHDVDTYIQRHRGEIELNERNQAILQKIDMDQKRKQEVQDKIAELVEEFNQLVEEERYPEAEVLAGQVRELDPESPIARTLMIKSKLVKRVYEQERIRGESEEGFYEAMTSVARSGRPFNDAEPIDFGDVRRWNELTLSRQQMLESQRRQLSPVEQDIQEALKEKVEVRFEDRPLKEVLETLGAMVGVNTYLDPAGMAAEGVTSDTPVSISLSSPISLRSALNLILDQLRLSYVIQNEVLLITSEQTRDSKTYPRVYNVADLVIPIPNFIPGYNVGLPAAIREAHHALGYGGMIQPASMAPMPLTIAANEAEQGAGVNPSLLASTNAYGMIPQSGSRPSQPPGYGPGYMGGAAMADFDTLIELITSTIAPETWSDVGGPGAIESFPTNLSLVISTTQDVHDQIVDLLRQLRRLQDLQVTIEVKFITLRDNWFERIGVDFDFDIDDNVTSLPRDDEGPSTIIGLDQDGLPTSDWDLSFTQDGFATAVPAFGGFDATTAANFGFAILSDIEVFFLLQAAEGDERSNVLQAPKVTLFNGQLASVNDTSQRPFVTSLIPVVGDFAAAHQPVIVVLSEGTSLSVQAVVSSDRRYVRLTLVPFFSQIGAVDTFTFSGKTTSASGSNVVDANGDVTGKVDDVATSTEGTTVQLPTFSFTTVSTTVSVPDGGTVLLGGIKRLREGRNEEGVPMLSKLPYVNRLFNNVGIGRETQSLMLMVTPRIIIQEEEEGKLGIEITP